MDKAALHFYIDLFRYYVLTDSHPKTVCLINKNVNRAYCDEGYKYSILKNAKECLKAVDWINANEIEICDAVIRAVNKSSNLVNRNTRSLFVQAIRNHPSAYTRIFRSLYGNLSEDETCFADLCKLFGAKYGLIAYLFFIKAPNKYLPIAPMVFDRLFPLIGIDYPTAYRCTWKNYMGFLDRVKEVQAEIQRVMQCKISLLNTHSFLWILEIMQEIPRDQELILKDRVARTPGNKETKIDHAALDYSGAPRKKEGRSTQNATDRFAGKSSISRAALENAAFQCEVDPTHKTFIKKSNGKPYMEAHHLIPLMYSERFHYSLDNVANIVSLCSNCHNQLHYGKEVEPILKRLYEERKERLAEAGIGVTLKELLLFYK